MPKLSKVAWRLRPSHGFSSEHSGERMKRVLEAVRMGEEGEGIGEKKENSV